MEGWKAGFACLAVTSALLCGATPVTARPVTLAASPAPAVRGLSDIVTRLYLGHDPQRDSHALLRLQVERSLRDPRSVGTAWVARELDSEEQSSDGSFKTVVPAAVPDLDGDGGADFLRIEYDLRPARFLFEGTVSVDAYRGTDARAMWTSKLRVEGSFPLLYTTRDGDGRGHGLIVEQIGVADLGDAYAPRLGLAALNGAGDLLWERSFEPERVGSSSVRVERIPLEVRFADVAKGPANDALVGLATLTGPNFGLVHALVAETSAAIVEGRKGDVLEPPGTELNWSLSPRPGDLEYGGDWIPEPLPGPDVSGDGVADYFFAFSQPRHEGRLSMRSSADGTELWEVDGVPIGLFTNALTEWDLDGDDVKDLLLTTFHFPPVADESLPSGDLLRAISGSDGSTLWTGTGRFASVPGDVDRDGSPDVATVSTFFAGEDRVAGIEYAAFGGSDGKPLYATTYTLPYEPAASAFLLSIFGSAGDLDADRVGDFHFNHTLAQPKHATQRASAMVSGRNGKKLFDGLPWIALGESFDGRGTDVFKAAPAKRGRRIVFTLADGRSRGVLWSAVYEVPGKLYGTGEVGPFAPWLSDGDRFTRDGCPDVWIVLPGDDGMFVAVLDGRDGSLVWSRRVSGKGGDSFGSALSLGERARC